jgi:hypothetical protein
MVFDTITLAIVTLFVSVFSFFVVVSRQKVSPVYNNVIVVTTIDAD